jgi:hypothetical protein
MIENPGFDSSLTEVAASAAAELPSVAETVGDIWTELFDNQEQAGELITRGMASFAALPSSCFSVFVELLCEWAFGLRVGSHGLLGLGVQ